MPALQNRTAQNPSALDDVRQLRDQLGGGREQTLPSIGAPLDHELQQLRDVHPPTPVGVWPPAPGWWLVMVCAAAALLLIARRLQRRRQRRAPYRAVLAELDRIATHRGSPAQLQEVAVLLRRMALLTHPGAAALPAEQLPEHLFGVRDEWLVSRLAERFAPAQSHQPSDTAAAAAAAAAIKEVLKRLRVVIKHAMTQAK